MRVAAYPFIANIMTLREGIAVLRERRRTVDAPPGAAAPGTMQPRAASGTSSSGCDRRAAAHGL